LRGPGREKDEHLGKRYFRGGGETAAQGEERDIGLRTKHGGLNESLKGGNEIGV